MNTIRGLRDAVDLIGEKHADEPDFEARDWRFESDEEIELHGDDLARAGLDDEL